MKKPSKDRTGQKFGDLEVLCMRFSTSLKYNMWMAVCKCHRCGNDNYEIRPSSLVNRSLQNCHCGCSTFSYDHPKGKDSITFKGHKEMGGSYLGNIRIRARKIRVECNLDNKYLYDLYKSQKGRCALSGADISFHSVGIHKNEGRYGRFCDGTASLDRIDSSVGYIKGNVQWVYKIVNIMKGTMSDVEFLSWCQIITDNKR